jgi:predicted Holliday junction resolvase-like endonuclease
MIILSSILAGLVLLLLFHAAATSDHLRKRKERIDLLEAKLKADQALLSSKTALLTEIELTKNDLLKQRRELQLQLATATQEAHTSASLFIAKESERIRTEAIAKSKQVQKGFTAEHFAPFQMEFNPRDYNHLGNPVDYLIFAGSTAIKDGTQDHIDEVLFLDIKTGEADLNKTQRRIRDAIVEGRVNFATWNQDTNTLKRYQK